MAAGGKREGAGRKKGFPALQAEAMRKFIAEKLIPANEPIINKAIEQAEAGDKAARDFLYDRAYGKPNQAVDVTSEGKALPTPLYVLPKAND